MYIYHRRNHNERKYLGRKEVLMLGSGDMKYRNRSVKLKNIIFVDHDIHCLETYIIKNFIAIKHIPCRHQLYLLKIRDRLVLFEG